MLRQVPPGVPVSILWGADDPWEDMREGRRLFGHYPCVTGAWCVLGCGVWGGVGAGEGGAAVLHAGIQQSVQLQLMLLGSVDAGCVMCDVCRVLCLFAVSVTEFVELPGVGHCPQDEAPEVVNPLIEAWVLNALADNNNSSSSANGGSSTRQQAGPAAAAAVTAARESS